MTLKFVEWVIVATTTTTYNASTSIKENDSKGEIEIQRSRNDTN
jgi:hypothetical protein